MGWEMMKCDAVGKVGEGGFPMGYIYRWILVPLHNSSEHGPW